MCVSLPREVDAFLCELYRVYLQRRKDGMGLEDSRCFGDSAHFSRVLFPGLSKEDVIDLCWSLHSYGFLAVLPGDDEANEVTLTDQGIVYMEQRFGRKLDKVLSYISKVKSSLFL